MANANAPFGLRPLRRLDGAMPNYQTNNYQINIANTNKIGCGDIVKFSSGNAGFIDIAAATDTPVLGVLSSCDWYDTAIKQQVFSPWWYGSTTAVAPINAYVYDDVNIVFEIQSNASGPVTQANVKSNAKIATVTAPNATTGISTEVLDAATIVTNQATYPLKIVQLGQRVGNDNTSIYNVVEVILNNTYFKVGVA